MKFCEIIIEPTAALGTPLKGDTIFGHFCWQAAENDILHGGLDRWIECYEETPFAVFSSAFPKLTEHNKPCYALPRPALPSPITPGLNNDERCDLLKKRKTAKKKSYMLIGEDLQPSFSIERYRSEGDLFQLHLTELPAERQKDLRLLSGKNRKLLGKFEQAHNTINRLSMTTGTGQFAPFSQVNMHYQPHVRLAIFALFNEDAVGLEQIKNAFINMGRWGFGRDASAGLGRFTVIKVTKRTLPQGGGKSAYTMAPSVPKKGSLSQAYFNPFTRFGKHGAALIHTGKPFKNPVVMADEGAVFTPKNPADLQKPYLGTAIRGLSKADERTVMQGYSIYLPCDI